MNWIKLHSTAKFTFFWALNQIKKGKYASGQMLYKIKVEASKITQIV